MTAATKALAGLAAGALLAAPFMLVQFWKGGPPWANPFAKITNSATANATPETIKMLNNWHVMYQDADLGYVEGKAVVDWEKGRAVVTLEHPSTHDKAILTADDVQIDKTNTEVTMRLRGSSPGASCGELPSTEGMKRITAEEGQQLSITPGELAFSAAIKEKARPDLDGVRLTLRASSFGSLRGQWSYLADPITKRNGRGLGPNARCSGRTGYFRLLDDNELDDAHAGFLGEQSGREEWSPLPSEIAATIVMEEQLSSKSSLAEYPYPYYGGLAANEEKKTSRTLFVVGRNFPVFNGGRVLQDVRWDDADNIKNYRIVAVSTDPDLNDKDKERIEDGWKKALQLLDDDSKRLARETLDAAIIVADTKQGILPGPKQFTWGEGSGVWFLQFGDNVADARIVRPIRMKNANDTIGKDEFERTLSVFLPETLMVEIEIHAPLPLGSIPVRIASKSAPGSMLTMPAERVAGRAGLYRTRLFSITGSGTPGGSAFAYFRWMVAQNAKGMPTVTIHPGDEIMATVQMDDVAFIAPPVAKATVRLTPDQPEQKTSAPANTGIFRRLASALSKMGTQAAHTQPGSTNVKLWKEALVLAVKADKVPVALAVKAGHEPVENFGTLAGHTLPPYHGIAMTVGDHAAMLLLRSAFLDMMQEQLRDLESIKSDDDVAAFREWIRPFMADSGPLMPVEDPPVGWVKYPDYLKTIEDINKLREFVLDLPGSKLKEGVKAAVKKLNGRETKEHTGFGKGTYFGELEVPGGPTDETWEYFTTYWPDEDLLLYTSFYNDRERVWAWRLQATRAVIAQYIDAIRSAIETVKAIPDSDTKELAKLTGIGFGPVVARVLPQLMRLDDSTATLQWVPDLEARATVENLYVFAAAARAAEEYSDAKWHVGIAIVKVALTPPLGLTGVPYFSFSEGTAAAVTWVAVHGILAWETGEAVYDQVIVRSDLDLFFGASAVLGVDRLEETKARKVTIEDAVERLASQFAIDSIWDQIKEGTAPVSSPKHDKAMMTPFQSVVVLAADTPRASFRQRVRSFAVRILGHLGIVNAERAIPRIRGQSLNALKQRPKQELQKFLQLASRGGARIEQGEAASRAQVEAAFEARRLQREIDQPVDPAKAKASIAFGDEGEMKAPNGGNKGIGLQPAPPLPKPKLAAPHDPPGVAFERKLPLTGAPARDKSWIAIREATGETVYYKSVGVDEKGEPIKLGEGRSSNVYPLTNVDNRRRHILDGDGSVLKILRNDDKFGTAREQILRMKESYELLKAAKAADPSIEFPEILEFHEDANPPYLIQRRLKFDGKAFQQVKAHDLMKGVFRPGGDIPPTGNPLDFKDIVNRNLFPRELRRAVVELHFALAAHHLIAADLSLPNIYFRNVGGRWVAGILDIDHIAHIKRPRPEGDKNYTWNWIRDIRDQQADLMPSTASDGRALRTSFTFMEKALELEHGGNLNVPWIRYDSMRDTFVPVLIEPELVEKVFAEFRMRLRPGEPKKRSCVRPIQPSLSICKKITVAL